MKLNPIAANQNVVTFSNGVEVFISYETPVAAYVPGEGWVRTSTKWSVTTTRHINKWLGGSIATEKDQSFFDGLTAEV